jgi:hypothetical protein
MVYFLGRDTRNRGYQLKDPRPIKRFTDDICSGDAGKDGFTCLSKASPTYAGDPPPIGGHRRARSGPDQSFEQ